MDKVLLCIITASGLSSVCSQPSYQFHFIHEVKNWTEARRFCRDRFTDLAGVRAMDDVNVLYAQSLADPRSTAVHGLWIGLYRDTNGWMWVDGSPSSFMYWDVEEPGSTEACVVANLQQAGRWQDWLCDRKTSFICQNGSHSTQVKEVKKMERVVKVKLGGTSSVDLNYAVTLEELLKQLKQQLKDQGVNPDVKLSWRTLSDGKIFHKDVEQKDKL
ncbi:snaclec agkisacutacin subunit A-like [Cololabis saira]|uniref:snaclec agkisacutacin subunit A-like n=1 Tax=Cololabis saira TaxID=129043 RepID=UPI002AD2054D|nr:snaclec agkisacutacin subunit A-like [Cololabis saira]